ncbi:helix-turn-helix domain-containing protein [Streptomyces sp. SID10815]|uniref:helix-turn-helix domain-containing protein n=1 Tax=Streptomyces sp. SID10815 TaxID=2706027 RepID=UPI0013CBCFE1|nr:helix-turn-helix domain-containing protein [Streptomyces sp. SID10815]NEA52387.1 helix-turn-helix domain-containing protein [Streptomyces sp. SID10815]
MLPAAPKLLTVAETAKLLRVSKPTIYRWAASGYLPSIQYGQPRAEGETRRGGAIRIPSSAVEELLTLAAEEAA